MGWLGGSFSWLRFKKGPAVTKEVQSFFLSSPTASASFRRFSKAAMSLTFTRVAVAVAFVLSLLAPTVTSQECAPAVVEPVCTLNRFVGSTASSLIDNVSRLGVGLNDPADADVVPSRDWLLIADSRNHAVRLLDFSTGMLYQISYGSSLCYPYCARSVSYVNLPVSIRRANSHSQPHTHARACYSDAVCVYA
jgi:hypothetical protein